MSFPLRPLSELADIQIGPFGSLLHKSDYIEDGVPVINPMHIAPDGISADPSFSVADEKARALSRYLLTPGEVIMGRRGEMGRCAIVKPEHAGMICGTGSMKIAPEFTQLHPEYLVHILRTPKAKRELENVASGITMLNLNAKALASLEIPLPPLKEQRRIAGILDQADALRRLRTRALDKLNTLGQAIFHEMFGDDFNTAQTSGQLTIGDVCSVSSGSTPSRKRPEFYEGDIPWVKTTEVNGRVILATEEKVTEEAVSAARLKTYPQDTVLVAMYGQGKTRGQVGILGLPATTNQACAAIQCGDELLPSFLFHQLKMSYSRLRGLGQGGNQPNLNAGLVKGFNILVPPLSEQELFVQRVDEIEAVSNKGRTGTNTENRLFASLQHRAFRGEL